MTTPVETRYRLIEKESRVIAVDENDIEICGARQPFGHNDWLIYVTRRVTGDLHHVIATTKAAATEHVRLIADLFTRGEQ